MNAAIQLLLPILKSLAQDEIDSLAALPTQAAKRKRLLEWLNSSFVSGSPTGYVAAALVGRSTRAQDALIKALVGVRLNPSTTVQSLVFDRSSFDVEHAKAWAKAHDFRYGDVDVQPTTIRLRQKDPSRFRTFRTKGLTQGVQAVIARNPRKNPMEGQGSQYEEDASYEAFLDARPGDQIVVLTRDMKKPRTLTVESRRERGADSAHTYVYTTSGKTWGAGRQRGGAIVDYGYQGVQLWYQPTMHQQIQPVVSLKVVRSNPRSESDDYRVLWTPQGPAVPVKGPTRWSSVEVESRNGREYSIVAYGISDGQEIRSVLAYGYKDPDKARDDADKARKKLKIRSNPVRRRRNPPVTNPLLAQMLALRTAYQYAHWNAKNYADHLLFEKLYTSLDGGIDILAEISQQHVEPVATPQVTARSLMAAENRIIKAAERAIEQDRPDPGLENFLLGLIEHRERAKYLLNQRSDRAANLDTEEREYREAALEGGVYKNPARRRPRTNRARRNPAIRPSEEPGGKLSYDADFIAGFAAGQRTLKRKPDASYIDAMKGYKRVSMKHGQLWLRGYAAAIDAARGAYAQPGVEVARLLGLVR